MCFCQSRVSKDQTLMHMRCNILLYSSKIVHCLGDTCQIRLQSKTCKSVMWVPSRAVSCSLSIRHVTQDDHVSSVLIYSCGHAQAVLGTFACMPFSSSIPC